MTKTADMLSDVIFNEASAPEFLQKDGKYTIKAKDNAHYSAGMYSASLDVKDCTDKLLKITIPYTLLGERISARALVRFFDENECAIQSDYFQRKEKEFTLKVEVPVNAEKMSIEMPLYCFGKGEVTYNTPQLEITEKEPHRIVRIASAYIERKGTFADNMENTLNVIEEASKASEKPDLLCFTECVLDLACKDRLYIKENGEEMQKVCETVKKSGMYVVFTAHEKDNDGLKYNTSFLISDKGEILGKYRKVFLTGIGEIKDGAMTPGSDFPVFDTPIGKIGMLICWDNWFPEGARELAKKGAEIVVWSTRGFHEERAITRAMDNGVYYIVSHSNPANCGIIEPAWGKWLARADGSCEQGFVTATIDLDARLNSQYKSFGRNGVNDRDMFVTESEIW